MRELDFGKTNITLPIPDPTTPQGIKDFLSQAGTFDIDEKSLISLESKYSADKIPADLSDKENYKIVKEVLADLRKSKKLIADQHRLYKAPVLEYGQRLDKIKREATPRVQALLDAWKDARDKYDAEQERIAQEEAQAEADRINKIESRICFIRDLPSECIGKSSEQIEREVAALQNAEEDFQEFAETGEAAKTKAIEQLENLLEQAKLKEEQERKAAEQEEARKKKEAEDREQLEKDQRELEIKTEAAELTASVVKFIQSTPDELRTEVKRIDERYRDAPQELHDAAVTAITALKSMIPAAEQREAVEEQQREQEAERKRLAAEKEAEEKRKAQAEADRVAAEEKAKQEAIDLELYKEAFGVLQSACACEANYNSSSRFIHIGTSETITISLGEINLLNRVERFISQQKIAFEASEKARSEAEARKAEDMGKTIADIADIMDYLSGTIEPTCGLPTDIAEAVTEAIVNGEISHVYWSNEK